MIRIVITGAESTGKTTLTEALAGYFGEPWTPEFVRRYVDGLERPLEQSDLEPIARGQLNQEDDAIAKAKRLVLHDTNLLSSIIYSNAYFDTIPDWVNDAFLRRDYTLYLLCEPDIPWIPDRGQRESPKARDRFHKIFKETLIEMKLPHEMISGSPSARFGQAVKAIESILQA